MSLVALANMFDSVPTLNERPAPGRRGKEVPKLFVQDVPTDMVINDPKAWLARYHIPIVEVGPDKLRGGRAAACFAIWEKHGEFVKAEVRIPRGSDINSNEVRWNVWHELGHAMDAVMTREEQLIATPHGMFSTLHIELLRKHQELIITWNPSENRDYKTSPPELWAECVACAIMDPARMPPDLLAGITPSLKSRNLPVKDAATDSVLSLEEMFT